MGLFDRSAPDWSPFDKRRTHDRFVKVVEATLREMGLPAQPSEGSLYIVTPPDGERTEFRLDNVAILCRDATEAEWPGIIAGHASALLTTGDIDTLLEDPESLRPALRVRLHPEEVASGDGATTPLVRPVAHGLVEVVVIDTPTTVSIIDGGRLTVLGLDEEEVFALGRDNLRQHEPIEFVHEVRDSGAAIEVAESESFYTATWALLLDEVLDIPAHGALVGIPNRHTLVAHRIDGTEVVNAVNLMLVACANNFAHSAGNLSPFVYWFRDGGLTQLDGHFDGQRVDFAPSDEFVQVLNDVVG